MVRPARLRLCSALLLFSGRCLLRTAAWGKNDAAGSRGGTSLEDVSKLVCGVEYGLKGKGKDKVGPLDLVVGVAVAVLDAGVQSEESNVEETCDILALLVASSR